MIQHVVLMRFADPSDAEPAAARLRALAPQIPEISALEVGVDVVGGEVSWHLALLTRHVSLEELRGYQAHPVHAEFGAWVRPRLEARAAVDYQIPGEG